MRISDWSSDVCSSDLIVSLRRLRVGPFPESAAISLDSLAGLMHNPAALANLRPVETALDGIPALALNGPEAKTLRNGPGVPVFRTLDRARFGHLTAGDQIVRPSWRDQVGLSVSVPVGAEPS